MHNLAAHQPVEVRSPFRARHKCAGSKTWRAVLSDPERFRPLRNAFAKLRGPGTNPSGPLCERWSCSKGRPEEENVGGLTYTCLTNANRDGPVPPFGNRRFGSPRIGKAQAPPACRSGSPDRKRPCRRGSSGPTSRGGRARLPRPASSGRCVRCGRESRSATWVLNADGRARVCSEIAYLIDIGACPQISNGQSGERFQPPRWSRRRPDVGSSERFRLLRRYYRR